MVVDLHAREAGSGAPLVLLHAFPLSSAMWDGQRESLADRCRVVTPDQRGFTGSVLGDDPPSLDHVADDVAALLDRLGLGRVVLGGPSMGVTPRWPSCDGTPSAYAPWSSPTRRPRPTRRRRARSASASRPGSTPRAPRTRWSRRCCRPCAGRRPPATGPPWPTGCGPSSRRRCPRLGQTALRILNA